MTPSLTGTASKVYDATTAASLVAGNFSVAGAIDGDTVTLNTASGSYNDKNVGTGKTVSASGLSLAGATNGAVTVYGYQLASTSASGNIGTITQRAITVTAAANSKTYDALTTATATPTITTGALQGTDTASFAESYASKNAGTGLTLTPTGIVNDGNGGGNYAVTFANANTGIITPASLIITPNTETKIYDGTLATTATPTITGLQGSDTASAIQLFLSKNVGTNVIHIVGFGSTTEIAATIML